MSYQPVAAALSPSPSPDPALGLDDDGGEEPSALLPSAADVDALIEEADLEAEHEEEVDAQLAAAAHDLADTPAAVEEGTASSALSVDATAPASLASAEPSPLASEVFRPSEMSAEELKAHMADVADRVSRDVAEMEQKAHAAPAHIPGQIVIAPGKHDRLVRTVFGFTVHCRCIVNDEVRLTVWIVLILGVLCGLGFFIADVTSSSFDLSAFSNMEHGIAIGIGGLFSFLACVLSYMQIKAHYANWVHPPSQRCVVRILFMVPVYSISAWLSLTFIHYSLYIDFIRMCYEAFVIYTFMILLTKYLGGHNGVVEWMKTKPPLPWPSPMCCVPPVKPGNTFLYWLKYGTLQYTIISPIISIIAMVLNFFSLYGDGVFAYNRGYVYISFVQNCTQLISLYCLVWLYVAMKNELAPFSPMAKFLVVKSVVFFTFWQSVGLAVLVKASILTDTAEFDVGTLQVGLQDFIVCIEMFIAAAVHYTFGWETYANGTMKLLMDQRAMYLAEMSYKRAQEEQKKEEERLLKEERRKLGLDSEDEAGHEGGSLAEVELTTKRRRKGKGKKRRRSGKPGALNPAMLLTGSEHAIDISPGPEGAVPVTPVLDPTLFSGDDDDDNALVDDDALTVSERGRRELFAPPPSLTLHTPRASAPATSAAAKSPAAAAASASHPPPHLRRSSAGASALHLLEGGARGLIGSARSVLLPVSSFFVHDDDDALFDEEAGGRKPILLTDDMRREIEERVRREAADKHARRRSSTGGDDDVLLQSGGGGSKGKGKRRSGDYAGISMDDGEVKESQHSAADDDAGL